MSISINSRPSRAIITDGIGGPIIGISVIITGDRGGIGVDRITGTIRMVIGGEAAEAAGKKNRQRLQNRQRVK